MHYCSIYRVTYVSVRKMRVRKLRRQMRDNSDSPHDPPDERIDLNLSKAQEPPPKGIIYNFVFA